MISLNAASSRATYKHALESETHARASSHLYHLVFVIVGYYVQCNLMLIHLM